MATSRFIEDETDRDIYIYQDENEMHLLCISELNTLSNK